MFVNLYGITNILELTNKLFFFNKSGYEKGLTHANDLLDETGNFLSIDTLQKKFSIKTNHVTYNGTRMTI